jgi:DNA-binding CsgD family transcriptional regulator
MTDHVLIDGGWRCMGVPGQRAFADGPTPAAEPATSTAVLPRRTHPVDLTVRHSQALTEHYWDGIVAARSDPSLLIDADGGVLHMNAPMTALLARRNGVDVVHGRMRVATPAANVALTAAIGRATARDHPIAGATRVPRPPGGVPLLVTVSPLACRTRLLAPAEAAALVTVIDPTASVAAPATLLREAFDLTPREAELASLLSAGHSVESAAAVMVIGLATARLHLRRVLQKTRTSRQAELVRLLVRLA